MNTKMVYSKLQQIISDILEIDTGKINAETRNEDMAEWDSLKHVQIIDAVEREFNIKFDLLEIVDFESVADIAEAIENSTNEI